MIQASLGSAWSLSRGVLCAAGLLGAGMAHGQPQILFDEDDAVGADYRDASLGIVVGDDGLALVGGKMPVHAAHAYAGTTSGLVEYRHRSGRWTLAIRAEGAPQDWSDLDTLFFYVNGPRPIAASELPRFALEDAQGRRTAYQPFGLGSRVGYNAGRSGFEAGSSTDAGLRVEYVETLPPGQVRPGYPETLLITFADTPQDTSTATIGRPAIPAHFVVTRQAEGDTLDFRFYDEDGDGTLSTTAEYVEILTPEAEGSTRLRPTWRVELSGTPTSPPGAGDVFRLAVDNGGLDGDAGTWQRVERLLNDFGPPGTFDYTQVRALVLANGDVPNSRTQTLWVDYAGASAGDGQGTVPPPSGLRATAGDRSVVLEWAAVEAASGYHVYRQADADAPFERLTGAPAAFPEFADVTAENGVAYTYVVRSLDGEGRTGPDGDPLAATPDAARFDAFLDLLQRRAFAYFWNEANPANGLVKDRSTDSSPASIAAVGFGLSALIVGIERGWITRAEGTARVLATLRFFWNSEQSTAPDATGYKGFYYHFLDMQTGRRVWNSELSTIDTALLLGGVLHAAVYFQGSGDDETEIRTLADAINDRVDWVWAAPRPPLVALGWRPETGFIGFDWRGYNEAMILYLLALGSPTHPLPAEAWTEWTSTYRWETHYGESFVVFPPLFGHQYSHVWIDFRGIQDAYMRERGLDYFENSRRATLAQRAYAVDNPRNHDGYSVDTWGLTASDVPGGYRARGAPPAQNDDGTIAPTAPGGSVPFAPKETIATLRGLYQAYRSELWGPYGFQDAINPGAGWVARDVIGIDQGPILLMIENYRSGMVWGAATRHPAIQNGLARADFRSTLPSAEDGVPGAGLALDVYPNPARGVAEVVYEVPTPGPVRLVVYDVLGREVTRVVDAAHTAGAHRAHLDLEAWPAGLYFVRLRHGEAAQTRPLVRVR